MKVKCSADSQIHHPLLPALFQVPCHSVRESCISRRDSLNISYRWTAPSTAPVQPLTRLLSFSSWLIDSSSDTESQGLGNRLNDLYKSELKNASIVCEIAQQIQRQRNGCLIPGMGQGFLSLFLETSSPTWGLSACKTYEVSDPHDGDCEDRVLWRDAVWSGRNLSAFRRNVLPISSGLFSLQSILKMNATSPAKLSVNLYQTTPFSRTRRW
jgi:hypothetical protein